MAKKKPAKRVPRSKPHWLSFDGETTVTRLKGITRIDDFKDSVLLSPSELRELVDWVGQNGYGDESK